MAETVVYVSKTGFTERYARMLAERLGTRALPLDEAVKSLGKGGDGVFCGRVRAERVCGLAKAVRRFDVVCVCAVGATAPDGGKYAGRLASVNRVQVPLFYLRGGLDYSRMGGAEGALLRKLVPKVMGGGTDGATRELFAEGGDFVSEENLADVTAFLAKRGDGGAAWNAGTE